MIYLNLFIKRIGNGEWRDLKIKLRWSIIISQIKIISCLGLG